MEPLIIPIIALIAAWILGALFTKALIPFMEKKQFRQYVREEGPQSHLKKTGTPSMGGTAHHIGNRNNCINRSSMLRTAEYRTLGSFGCYDTLRNSRLCR